MGDNIFPKRRNWHSGTNYIFLPSHFCICLEMQRRIAIVAIWNNCDRSVLSVLVVPVHQNRTHKLMHHAFKTWCIVSTSGRFSIKTTGFVRSWWFFLGDVVPVFVGRFRGERRAWGGCCALRFCVYALNYKMRCAVCRRDEAWGGSLFTESFPFPPFSRWHLHGKHGIILLEYN